MRALLGIVVSAVVLFVWGFIYWALLPYPSTVLRTLPEGEQAALISALEGITNSGVYMVPGGADTNATDPTFTERHEAGPLAMLFVHKGGLPVMPPSLMFHGFLHMLGASVIAAIILMASGRREFFGRFMICFWLGLFVAVWPEISRFVWFYFPWNYCLLYMVYHFTSCILMGIVLGITIRPAEIPEAT